MCIWIYDATEGGRSESETSPRRNVSLVWKTELEWRKRRKVTALSNTRFMSAHSMVLPLIDCIMVVVCSYIDKCLIKIRIQRPNLFSILLNSGFRSWMITQWSQTLCYSLLCPRTDTFTLNTEVVKRGPYKLTQSVSSGKLCSFLSWASEDKNTIPPPSIKCILYI